MFLTTLKAGKGGVVVEWFDKQTVGASEAEPMRPETAPAPPPIAGRRQKPAIKKVKVKRPATSRNEVKIQSRMDCADPGHPDLQKALQAFVPLVVDFLGLPDRYAANFAITSVHRSEQAGGRKAVIISGVKTLTGSARPFNISTPLIEESKEVKPDKDPLRPIWEALDKLIYEAVHYINGKRAQAELFGAEKEAGNPAGLSLVGAGAEG